MSGLEVAGLVLGVFPILVDTIKDVRGFLKDVKGWWHFETEFESFMSAVDMEHIHYSLNIEILVGYLNIPRDDQKRLQQEPTCALWHEPQIHAEVRRRIQDKYWRCFLNIMGEINGALTELRGLLSLDEVGGNLISWLF